MKKKHLIRMSIIAATLVIFLISTNPGSISLPLVLVPYALAALLLYELFLLIFAVWFRGGGNKRKIKLYSIILTVVIINFALLKSIGQLTIQDGIISVAIIVVSAIYISKFSLQ